jgi:seryl-tRNA synthetase
MNIKLLKQRLFKLNKIKRKLRKGSDERSEILKEIREIKKQISEFELESNKLQPLIDEIVKLEPGADLVINYKNYTKEELLHHIEYLKQAKKNGTYVPWGKYFLNTKKESV